MESYWRFNCTWYHGDDIYDGNELITHSPKSFDVKWNVKMDDSGCCTHHEIMWRDSFYLISVVKGEIYYELYDAFRVLWSYQIMCYTLRGLLLCLGDIGVSYASRFVANCQNPGQNIATVITRDLYGSWRTHCQCEFTNNIFRLFVIQNWVDFSFYTWSCYWLSRCHLHAMPSAHQIGRKMNTFNWTTSHK